MVNPNVDEDYNESLAAIRALIGTPLLFKKAIDQSRLFAKNKLKI